MQFTVAIYYTINSQNFKYLKDNSIVKKTTSQVGAIIFDTYMEFESYTIKL